MNNKQFTTCLEDRIDLIKGVLDNKSKEYSHDGDRLYNFKEGAVLCGSTPKLYLLNLMTKHLQCVKDLCHERLDNNAHLVSEKIGDSINYLILLEALMSEERGA